VTVEGRKLVEVVVVEVCVTKVSVIVGPVTVATIVLTYDVGPRYWEQKAEASKLCVLGGLLVDILLALPGWKPGASVRNTYGCSILLNGPDSLVQTII
jgi:hypothetical protein